MTSLLSKEILERYFENLKGCFYKKNPLDSPYRLCGLD